MSINFGQGHIHWI